MKTIFKTEIKIRCNNIETAKAKILVASLFNNNNKYK